ncbi:Mu transposase C-terminal domain-containing protein [Methylobacterium sp. J-072]|uniref:Mu transposase C-terminal domain-containing protein n=1 Tax=Methylobacterium sp. J-072 TaxID=2836651 RepID=UPI001FBAC9CC|nr:Mu transposase C-terminal domain-containing protein [Methylobacterium sp. J-072]MCJ2094388.1 Mu transposase C-terminal domain-containing protein [Methylobacterium sp. J-072]
MPTPAISPDGAWAFRGDWTRQVLADLSVQFDASQIGQPNRRSHIERSFGTTRTQFLSLFSGQTFANVADKGAYDAVENASVFVDELAQALVIYDIDVYHNTPHEGLNGETPRNAWIRLMRERGAVRVVPGAHQQRTIFGIHITRTLTRMGIRVFGLHYQSEELARVLANKGNLDLPVRLDVEDLGWISVQIGKAWVTVPCATSGLEGATVRDWLSVVRDQRRRHKIAAAASRPVIAEALQKIRAIAAKAERRFTIAPHTYNAALIGRAEEELFRGFDVPVDSRRSDPPSHADPLAQGIPVTGPLADLDPGPSRRRRPPKPHTDQEMPTETLPPEQDSDDDWIMETPDV